MNKNKIVEVIVYPDRAFVTRLLQLKLTKGKQNIQFEELPPCLIKDSINVKIESKGLAKFEGIDIKEEYFEDIKNEEIKKIEDDLKILKDEAKKIDTAAAGLKDSNEFLNKIKLLKTDTLFKEYYLGYSNIEEIEKNINFFKDNKVNLINEEIKLIKKKYDLNKKIKALTAELNNKINSKYQTVININVSLDIIDEETYNIYLSYLETNAEWKPVYDARVDFKKEKINFIYYGMVKQFTGEDWKDAGIYLSTSNPAVSAYIPELTPYFLNLSEYPDPGQSQAQPISNQNNQSGGFNITFKISKKETVNGTGNEKKVLIADIKLPVTFEYRSIPKLSENVFVNGLLENSLEYPFLSGNVKIFHDGSYIGDSFIKNIVPNEIFNLSLGTDDNFKVKRELINRFKSKKGLTGNNIKYEYHYRITINNYKKSDNEISVTEEIPVSKNREIKIKIESVTDKIEPDEFGKLTWKKTAASSSKLILELIFSIEYPNNKVITGIE